MTSDEREKKLQRFLFEGDGEPEERLAELPDDLRQGAAELVQAARRLEAAGERELDALLAEGSDPELERAVSQRMRRIVDAETSGARARWLWLGALAAALVVAFAFLWTRDGGPPDVPAGFALGAQEALELVSPRGAVERFEVFEWRATMPRAGWFELSIWDAEADALAEPLLRKQLEVTRWVPTRDLPASIRWEVVAVKADGDPVERAEVEAHSSSD